MRATASIDHLRWVRAELDDLAVRAIDLRRKRAALIRELQQEGWTQEQIATEMQVTRQAVGLWAAYEREGDDT